MPIRATPHSASFTAIPRPIPRELPVTSALGAVTWIAHIRSPPSVQLGGPQLNRWHRHRDRHLDPDALVFAVRFAPELRMSPQKRNLPCPTRTTSSWAPGPPWSG